MKWFNQSTRPAPGIFGRFFLITFFSSGISWAQLAPDDPTISDSLGVWLNDAANNFDEETGVWTDSSGNGRDAVPVGEVNVTALRNFLAPAPSTTSGGDFSTDDLASVKFGGDIEDLLVVEGINGGTTLTDLTLVVVYNVDPLAAIPSQVRPVGIGSVSALQANPGDHFNLGSDPSVRKDNGQIGAGTYSAPFPNQTTFIRIARMSSDPNTIDEWFNIDGTLQKVLAVTDVSFTTSTDDFFLGDVRAGATGTPGLPGGNAAIADFDIVQAIAYNNALTDQQIADLSVWLAANPDGAGGGSSSLGLEITNLSVTNDRSSAELTWRSKPDKVYAVDLAYDLSDDSWLDLDDFIESQGEETTVTLPTYFGEPPAEFAKRAYFRVREVPAD
ncbi:MAG: hypothetical protein ACON38_13290 [Akkermansiaceae bacterium]